MERKRGTARLVIYMSSYSIWSSDLIYTIQQNTEANACSRLNNFACIAHFCVRLTVCS